MGWNSPKPAAEAWWVRAVRGHKCHLKKQEFGRVRSHPVKRSIPGEGEFGGAGLKLTAPLFAMLNSAYARISRGTVTHEASPAVLRPHPPAPLRLGEM